MFKITTEVQKIIGKAKKEDSSYLDLSGLELKEIPEEVGSLINLSHLNLSVNHLFKVPKGLLSKLPNLISLSLTDNLFTHIPDSLGELVSLEMLFLSSNRIGNTPVSSISKLQNLQRLHLSYNRFTEVPRWIMDMPNLEHFNISRNKIQQSPDWIKNHPKLDYLSFDMSDQLDLDDNFW